MLVVRGVPLLQVGSSFFMPLDFLVTDSTNEKVSAAEESKALLLKLAMLCEGDMLSSITTTKTTRLACERCAWNDDVGDWGWG